MNASSSKARWIIAGAALLAVFAGYYLVRGSGDVTGYITAEVTRGPVVRAVTATGTVNPEVTVQVGTYVSGPVVAIYADFNSPVKAGELIAKIDPRPFEIRVAGARAALANARAQLLKAQADLIYKKSNYERTRALLKENAVSPDAVDLTRSSYGQAVAQVELDKAAVQQAEANLRDAEVQLGYTNITSPVDGTVVSRNVDVGQTVAASFQTPTLFLIARDLGQMQVDANVSEADIGEIHNGLRATFTVDAYPEREFAGTVAQVRNAPITVQNVVTYDVVIAVPNPQMLLKPGMTANVTLVLARRDNVIRAPIEALRFSPNSSAASYRTDGDEKPSRTGARVWVQSGSGLKQVDVKTGLDDGRWVELLDGSLRPGDVVVTGEIRAVPTLPLRGGMRIPR
jgi:HlyD family secretion protein